MTRRALASPMILAILVCLLSGCSAISQAPSVPAIHPEDVSGSMRVECRDCHSNVSTGALKPYDSIRHSSVFIRQHGMYSRQGQNLCLSCHGPSFCQGCHARKEELKPATRMGDRPALTLQHRGDYIVLHRMEGRIDPGSCFGCHGNKNDATCRACHR